jgi:beta-galactosidase
VRRLAREHVTFTVEGEGCIIGDASIAANPRQVEWGSAPVLVRSTHKAGPIRIIARSTFEGIHAPVADTLTIESIPYEGRLCHDEAAAKPRYTMKNGDWVLDPVYPPKANAQKPGDRRKLLEEVEKQQQDFGIQ